MASAQPNSDQAEMWPMLLDWTEEDCRTMLRHYEIEAFASLVSTLRAQGDFTSNTKRILDELAVKLSIPPERKFAEIRRAANDEKLFTIAYKVAGHRRYINWLLAGQEKLPYANGVPKAVPTNGLPVTKSANLQAENDQASPLSQSSKCSSVKPPCEPEEMIAKSTSESGNELGELTPQVGVADIVMENESGNEEASEASDRSLREQRDSTEQNGQCTKQDTNSPPPLPPLSPSIDSVPSPTEDGDTNGSLRKRLKTTLDRGPTPPSIDEPSTSKAFYQNTVGFGSTANSDSLAESLESSDVGQIS